MKFIIGYKQSMSQAYREDGTVVPVTMVKAEPVVVTQIKTREKDGYDAVQIGVGGKRRVGSSVKGHIAKIMATSRAPFHRLREIRLQEKAAFSVGDMIGVSSFQAGDVVSVTGISKGKGFQGVVKRHGFRGGPASHGNKDQLRMPGSIGAGEPQHVFKGTRMAGRMGGDRVTVKNLEIISVNPEQNVVSVKGALPGARNSLVIISGDGEGAVIGSIFTSAATEPADSSQSMGYQTQPQESMEQQKPQEEQAANDQSGHDNSKTPATGS